MIRLILTAILFISSLNFLLAQCEECKSRFIIIYDLDVTVPLPQGSDSIAKWAEWTDLFYVVGGLKNYVWNNASSNCIVKLCSAFFTEPDSINTMIKFGIGHPNLPPQGNIAGGSDYIFWGSISGVEGSYVLQLNLETAKSRERVKGVTINFNSGFDPFAVGENAGSYFGNLYETMLGFEKEKRDEGEPYAIRPKIEAVPEKTVLEKNESTTVEFTVKDCDGEPLKNRTIEITSEKGTFDKETIDTDESGKATATFTAGMETGLAKVNSTLVYRMPTEATSLSTSDGGKATIEIEKQKYWKLNVRYYWKRTSEEVSSTLVSTAQSNSVETHDLTFTAFFDMASAWPGTFYTNSLVDFTLHGAGHHFQTSSHSLAVFGEVGYIDEISNGNCSAKYEPPSDMEDAFVNFGSDGPEILFSVSGEAYGEFIEKVDSYIIYEGHTYENNVSECSGSESAGYDFHAFYDQDTSYNEVEKVEQPELGYTETTVRTIVKSFLGDKGVYVINYVEGEEITTEVENEGSSSHTVVKYDIEMVGELITDIVTSVDDEVNLLKKSYIEQNYPNPFNPETKISYNLAEPRFVSLKVYDVLGNEVALLVNDYKLEGSHNVLFNGSSFPSGVYFYQLKAGEFSDTKKMMILK